MISPKAAFCCSVDPDRTLVSARSSSQSTINERQASHPHEDDNRHLLREIRDELALPARLHCLDEFHGQVARERGYLIYGFRPEQWNQQLAPGAMVRRVPFQQW
jgi:hypothetical protein